MATKTAVPTRERIGRVGQRRQVVIPREILETLNLRERDFVAFARQANASGPTRCKANSSTWPT